MEQKCKNKTLSLQAHPFPDNNPILYAAETNDGCINNNPREVTNRVPKKKNICIEKMNLMLGERTIVYTPNENEYVYNYLDYPLLARYNYNTTTIQLQ